MAMCSLAGSRELLYSVTKNSPCRVGIRDRTSRSTTNDPFRGVPARSALSSGAAAAAAAATRSEDDAAGAWTWPCATPFAAAIPTVAVDADAVVLAASTDGGAIHVLKARRRT